MSRFLHLLVCGTTAAGHYRPPEACDEEGGRRMTAAELLCMTSASSGSKLRLPEAEDLWHAVEARG